MNVSGESVLLALDAGSPSQPRLVGVTTVIDRLMIDGSAVAFQAPIVRAGDREVIFVPEETAGTSFDASKITEIISRTYSNDLHGGC